MTADNLPPLPAHWVPINLVGIDEVWLPAIHRYAEAYARLAVRLALERAAGVCDEVEDREWRKFKTTPGTAGNPYNEGASDGAGECAKAIRELAKEYE